MKKKETLRNFKLEIENLHNQIVGKENISRDELKKVISLIEDVPKDNKLLLSLISELIDETRIFNYKKLFNEIYNLDLSEYESSINYFKRARYYDQDDRYLTPDQEKVIEEFFKKRRLIVSAPTSFGKSLLITKIIELSDYKNIALILPTKALLYETTNRLMKNPKITGKYNLINSTTTKDLKDRNIFIMTPERLDSYLDEHKLEIDFFVVDEIYKVSNKHDDRNTVFANVIYRLIKMKSDFYMIGPFFNKFSPKFLQKYDANFVRFEKSIVNHYFYDFNKLDDSASLDFNGKKIKKTKNSQPLIRKLLDSGIGSSLVYIGNKISCEAQAKNLALTREEKKKSEVVNSFIDYLELELSKEWTLVKCLRMGVAFHHGSMPKFIQVEIVEMLNRGSIDTVYCTPTIIEGVNTSAKNVIIADAKKGKHSLTSFDKKNIYGRAGRFSSHFSGNVINIESSIVDESETFEIEFPFLDKEILSDDEIILLDDEDVVEDLDIKNKSKMMEYLNKHNVDYNLIKKNKYISYIAQVNLVNYLRRDLNLLDVLVFKKIPKAESLEKIIEICHQYFFNESDKTDQTFNLGNLKRLTKYYVYKNPTQWELKEAVKGKSENTKIRRLFKLINHYFEFVFPRFIKVLENLVNYVAKEKNKDLADYSTVILIIEYGASEQHEIILRELGFPPGLIKKISVLTKDCNDPKEVVAKLKSADLKKIKLHPFEVSFLNNIIN